MHLRSLPVRLRDFENQQGVLFIYDDYELSELCTFFWVQAVDCERQLKMAD